MALPNTPTGLPQIDPNDPESTIPDAFNTAMQLLEDRTPSAFSSTTDRDTAFGTPGAYDRPIATVGTQTRMWDGSRWALITDTATPAGWTPYLYYSNSTGGLVPLAATDPSTGATNFTVSCQQLSVADNLVYFKMNVGFATPAVNFFNGVGNVGWGIFSSLPVTSSTVYGAGGAVVTGGGQMRSCSWFISSTGKQIGFVSNTGEICCNTYTWQAGDGFTAQGFLSVTN